jgi:hypothetical protein
MKAMSRKGTFDRFAAPRDVGYAACSGGDLIAEQARRV